MHIISMGMTYENENVCRGVFGTQSDIYGGAYLQKSRKTSL